MLELNSENIKKAPNEIGVYKIFVKNEEEQPITISRFCNNDLTGLLYIGQTNKQTLSKRIYQFYASAHLQKATHNHSGAQKYFKNQLIRETLGNHSLWFDYEITNAPEETEKKLLNDYFLQFGEYPPLNK